MPRHPSAARAVRALLWGLGSFLLFALVSRPLLSFWSSAIPASAANQESPAWRAEIAGDHMQLLYHFDMVYDMLRGRIPWFHNIWEFNTGSDADRFRPSGFFVPGSAVYGLLRFAVPQAAAWNLTLWLSLWISMPAVWAWLGGFTRDPLARIPAWTLLMLLPFRWAMLFGGSPSGIALMWIALLLLALDRSVRAPTVTKGFLLGGALLGLYWADLQLFYLAALYLPLFAILPWLLDPEFNFSCLPRLLRLFPGGLLSLATIAGTYLWRRQYLSTSLMQEGRGLREVALYSPVRSAFFTHRPGIDETVFLSPWTFAGLLAGGLFLLLQLCRTNTPLLRRRLIAAALLFAALGIGLSISLGTNGPFQAAFLHLARRLLPYFSMIRQPSKIFGIVPFAIAAFFALTFAPPPQPSAFQKLRQTACTLLAAGIGLSMFSGISATIALLPGDQPAYLAVVADSPDAPPRALVLPLWPGDSAETSIPIFFAHRHGIRLVNGYSPIVPQEYFEDIFLRLQSLNQGDVFDDQLDFLLERGVRHLLIHENRFPERVSPFPIHETVRRLEHHPRLEPLAQSGPVRAWRILESPGLPRDPRPRPFNTAFPARLWSAANLRGEHTTVHHDPAVWQHHYVSLIQEQQQVPRLSTPRARFPTVDDQSVWIRLRGEGTLHLQTTRNDEITFEQTLTIQSRDWHWRQAPFGAGPEQGSVILHLTLAEGELDIDGLLILAGDWQPEIPPEGITVPAVSFFRAGHPEPGSGSVTFLRTRDPGNIVLYGFRLPFLPGRTLAASLAFDSPAPPDTLLGHLTFTVRGAPLLHEVPVLAGQPLHTRWTPDTDLPVEIGFRFSRLADITLHQLTLRPADPQ